MPTPVIHGEGDARAPPVKSGRVAARMIGAAVDREHPGAPHGLFLTERGRLNQDPLAFIRG